MTPTLLVNEIFFSIQGESTFAGRPCVFVRLAGCNLRCNWCDTTYAADDEGQRMTVRQIVERVLELGSPAGRDRAGEPDRRAGPSPAPATDLVEITGGEPLLQPASLELMTRLADLGMTVLLETNGSLDIGQVDPRVIRIVDVKCPSSGQADENLWANLDRLTGRDEVKFVLADRADYEWARQTVARSGLFARCGVLFSPVAGRLSPADLASWILADRLAVRMQIQLHKVIWPGVDRGV